VPDLLRSPCTAAEVISSAQRFAQQDDISVISVTRTAVPEPALAESFTMPLLRARKPLGGARIPHDALPRMPASPSTTQLFGSLLRHTPLKAQTRDQRVQLRRCGLFLGFVNLTWPLSMA
jgi:hypothetical protein